MYTNLTIEAGEKYCVSASACQKVGFLDETAKKCVSAAGCGSMVGDETGEEKDRKCISEATCKNNGYVNGETHTCVVVTSESNGCSEGSVGSDVDDESFHYCVPETACQEVEYFVDSDAHKCVAEGACQTANMYTNLTDVAAERVCVTAEGCGEGKVGSMADSVRKGECVTEDECTAAQSYVYALAHKCVKQCEAGTTLSFDQQTCEEDAKCEAIKHAHIFRAETQSICECDSKYQLKNGKCARKVNVPAAVCIPIACVIAIAIAVLVYLYLRKKSKPASGGVAYASSAEKGERIVGAAGEEEEEQEEGEKLEPEQ